MAHDKFEEIINAANEETSIIKRENIIVIEDDEDTGREKEVVRPKTQVDEYIDQMTKKKKYARSEEKRKEIEADIETTKAVDRAITEILSQPVNITIPIPTKSDPIESKDTPEITTPEPSKAEITRLITTRDLDKPEVRELIKEKAKLNLEKDGQLRLDTDNIDKKIETAIAPLIEQKIKYTIDIPDIIVIQTNEQIKVYNDFDLDTSWWFDFDVPTDEIIIENLKTNEIETLKDDNALVLPDTLPNMIIGEMLNLEQGIHYDDAKIQELMLRSCLVSI